VTPYIATCDKSSVCPISLLRMILSKLLKRIIYYSMLKHVKGSLKKHQFGFLPNRSTLQQLLTFIKEEDVVYMDFRKAFDSVSHMGSKETQLYWYHQQAMPGCGGNWSNNSSVSEFMSALCKVLSQGSAHWDPCFMSSLSTIFQVCPFLLTIQSTKLQSDPLLILINFKKISIMPLTKVIL